MGKILELAYDLQIEGDLADREQALTWLCTHY